MTNENKVLILRAMDDYNEMVNVYGTESHLGKEYAMRSQKMLELSSGKSAAELNDYGYNELYTAFGLAELDNVQYLLDTLVTYNRGLKDIEQYANKPDATLIKGVKHIKHEIELLFGDQTNEEINMHDQFALMDRFPQVAGYAELVTAQD